MILDILESVVEYESRRDVSENSPGRSPGYKNPRCEESRQGRLNANPQVSAVPVGTDSVFAGCNPGLSSWAIFRRPFGTRQITSNQHF